MLLALEQGVAGAVHKLIKSGAKWVSLLRSIQLLISSSHTRCHMSQPEVAEPVTSVSVRMSSQASRGAPKISSSSRIPHKTHFSKAEELEMSSHPLRQLHQGSCPCLIKSTQTWLSTSISCLRRAFPADSEAPRAEQWEATKGDDWSQVA